MEALRRDLQRYLYDLNVFQLNLTYIAGRALITRLLHIPTLILSAGPTPSPTALSLARAALLRVIPYIRASTWDYPLYVRVVSQLDAILQPDKSGGGVEVEAMDGVKGHEEAGVPDMEWLEEARENERKEAARLDVELRGYMSNLIKESIRVCIECTPS